VEPNAAEPTPTPSAATPPPPTTTTAAEVPAPVTDEPAAAKPATSTTTDGVIVLPEGASGHRVYVDGKAVEVKGSRATVACGSHEVRIGSHGSSRKFDVACGAETTIPADPTDR
jgi:hypothetical protein